MPGKQMDELMNSNRNPIPPLGRVLETSLYVSDMDRARVFYETVLGLEPMMQDPRLTAYPAGPASVLLLFRHGTTNEPAPTPGGIIPPHDGSGRLHYAFSISADTLQAWRTHLSRHGVTIESEVNWPRGGCSLYFRDTEGNLVELATPGLWANY
jgi:catechol 2,3-dioxygenase-like lactoylglutathione lyase family enzyme